MLLLILQFFNTPLFARQRDTLGTGHPTYFVANQGQWNNPSLFQAQMHNAALFVESDRLTIALRNPHPPHDENEPFHHAMSQQMHAYRVNFIGCS